MDENERNRFVDDLLDASLARYRGVEPRSVLQNRILAQLRAESKAARYWAWPWRIGAGLVAAGVILALVSIVYRRPRPEPVSVTESPKPAPAVARSQTPSTAQAGQALAPRRIEVSPGRQFTRQVTGSADLVYRSAAVSGSRKRRSAEAGQSLALAQEPRRDVFPSPAPLSEEERLLVSYVRQSPDAALAAFPEDDQPLASLRVPDLSIPPLEMKEVSASTPDQTR